MTDPGRPVATSFAAVAHLLQALAHPARMQIVAMLDGADAQGLCVGELIDPLGLSQPAVSYHLRVLSTAGLVSRRRAGTWVRYSLDRRRLRAVLTIIEVGGRTDLSSRGDGVPSSTPRTLAQVGLSALPPSASPAGRWRIRR